MASTEAQKRWYQENKEHCKARVRRNSRARRDRILLAFGSCCSCCGENTREFLAIDHINGVSEEERSIARLRGKKRLSSEHLHGYVLAHLNEFQLLCHNCNLGRHLNGGQCPHEAASDH